MAPDGQVVRISDHVFLIRDTCHVYVLRNGREAVAIDIGSGLALDLLADLGVDRIAHVLVTHHHRDQTQGLARAISHGAEVWVPPVEHDLIRFADEAWQAAHLQNSYDVLQDRFGPLWSVSVAGTMPEYRTVERSGFAISTLPTPGHTVGSVSYLVEIDGEHMAFVGDLVAGPGKLWSLAATQWTYNGIEGVGATWHSAKVLASRRPTLILPSHGSPFSDVEPALNLLCERLDRLIDDRRLGCEGLASWWADPYETLTPHLLQNRTSTSRSYALLSDSGKALLIDFGYDFSVGLAPVGGRSTRRPLVATVSDLKAGYGIDRIDVVLPTHYHDDHVAGFNLLREVEGTRIWAAANFASILESPSHFDLPCLWYDPIPVERVLPLQRPIRWEEYELTTYELPGHTRYACAIAFEVDGIRVLASGDQQGTVPGVEPEFLNYTYRNRFDHRDFEKSARLYRALRPDLLISGHWDPRWVDEAYLDQLLSQGRALAQIHEDLLPFDSFDVGADGVAASLQPYQSTVPPNGSVQLEVEVRNPFPRDETCRISFVLAEGWSAQPPNFTLRVAPHALGRAVTTVQVDANPVRRQRVGCAVTWGDVPLGLAAEAVVSVSTSPVAP